MIRDADVIFANRTCRSAAVLIQLIFQSCIHDLTRRITYFYPDGLENISRLDFRISWQVHLKSSEGCSNFMIPIIASFGFILQQILILWKFNWFGLSLKNLIDVARVA